MTLKRMQNYLRKIISFTQRSDRVELAYQNEFLNLKAAYESLPKGEFVINHNGVKYPFKWDLAAGVGKPFVFFIPGRNDGSDCFQRTNYFKHLPQYNCIACADPTPADNKLSLTWFQGTRRRFYALELAEIWHEFVTEVISKSSTILYFCNDTAGFPAFYLAKKTPNATLYMANVQTDIREFDAGYLEKFVEEILDGDMAFVKSARETKNRFTINGNAGPFHLVYAQNKADSLHYQKHYQRWRGLADLTRFKSVKFIEYNDTQTGHGALPRKKELTIIRGLLENKSYEHVFPGATTEQLPKQNEKATAAAKQIHVHYGSWKSASTLIQLTLRNNQRLLTENQAYFVDQFGQPHKNFALEFRKAYAQYAEHGRKAQKTHKQCLRAAHLFEKLGENNGAQTIIHSWENFLGHPFSDNNSSLYHGEFTAWWFFKYLSHLPLTFSLITRNQADLVEAMYTQEVRKGRFLGTIDEFMQRYVNGRRLSWLPSVRPFVRKFGTEKVRVIPFETIMHGGSSQFVKRFFQSILPVDLSPPPKPVNPSFSAKAVEIALKTYPGLTQKQREQEEKRLVREYSNLKYPRSDFLGSNRRHQLLSALAKDNKVLFSQFVQPDEQSLLSEYLPSKQQKHTSINSNWLTKLYAAKPNNTTATIALTNLNQNTNHYPMAKLDEHLKKILPVQFNKQTVLVSRWAINNPAPKGLDIVLTAELGDNVESGSAELYFVELTGQQLGRTIKLSLGKGEKTTIKKTNAKVRYAVFLLLDTPRAQHSDKLTVSIKPAAEQRVADKLNFDGERFYPMLGDALLPAYKNGFADISQHMSELQSAAEVARISEEPKNNSTQLPPFFLTIDTESFYFKRPAMMTGEGLKGAKTAYNILNQLDSHKLKAIFYVNVYEHLQYGDDSVERLCKSIVERGHELALHCHKTQELDFYQQEIVNYDLDGQKKIIEYGKTLIYKWTGTEVINFRAGGYLHNSDTLLALEQLGFKIDSSFLYNYVPEELKQEQCIEPFKVGKLVELPILYVPLVLPDGSLSQRKLDINSLSVPELRGIVKRFAPQLSMLNFMMHSFSFIKRQRFDANDAVKNLLLTSPPLSSQGRFMGVTGLDDKLWNEFKKFLEFLADANGKLINVDTMSNYYDNLLQRAESDNKPQTIPLIYR